MNKLLCIVGPTATGKTALALKLAQQFQGDLLSADSRQVYRGMDIGTGKDIPQKFKMQRSKIKIKGEYVSCFSDENTNIWGLNIVRPDENFAVSEFVRYAISVIKYIWQKGKLPIIVGGTGLYVRALIRYLPEIFIPRDTTLRKHLHTLTTSNLQHMLLELNRQKLSRMNPSDQANPRRLVRAIEIERRRQTQSFDTRIINEYNAFIAGNDVLMLGLTSPLNELSKRIDERVEARVKQGIFEEIKQLLAHGYSWELPAMSGLGYKEWKEYIQNSKIKIQKSKLDLLKENTIEKWKLHEKQYAKRQMTWFRKEKDINWFDVTESIPYVAIAGQIQPWYNS